VSSFFHGTRIGKSFSWRRSGGEDLQNKKILNYFHRILKPKNNLESQLRIFSSPPDLLKIKVRDFYFVTNETYPLMVFFIYLFLHTSSFLVFLDTRVCIFNHSLRSPVFSHEVKILNHEIRIIGNCLNSLIVFLFIFFLHTSFFLVFLNTRVCIFNHSLRSPVFSPDVKILNHEIRIIP
jgi:energy-converting hydrogenase Eha subunit E